MGLAWLYLFYQILTTGKAYLHEPSMVILWSEITGIAALTGFGLWSFIIQLRGFRG
ncbi:hypothetical protein LCGC14_2065650 [marine sediment metagenome]|uniref:Uncharacterized protein n=1 Tax=marine sediment metagenome TaxID=412755 RepID=A0A0F9EJU3_9ZZZZ